MLQSWGGEEQGLCRRGAVWGLRIKDSLWFWCGGSPANPGWAGRCCGWVLHGEGVSGVLGEGVSGRARKHSLEDWW